MAFRGLSLNSDSLTRGVKTRYAAIPPWAARALLGLVLVLVVLPLLPHRALYIPGERHWGAPQAKISDALLYKSIVADLERGEDYYSAAAKEHRFFRYPTSPPQVFRFPLLAWILSSLHFYSLQLGALLALYALVLTAFYREVKATGMPLAARLLCGAIIVSGLSVIGVANAPYWHEVWAAFLIAAGLMCYRRDRWWISLLCALLACLIREIAFPFFLVMAGFALLERRSKECFAYLAAGAIWLAAYSLHWAHAVGAYQKGDIVSTGWLAFGGWNFVIATAKWNIVLHSLPDALIVFAISIGLIGLAGSRDARVQRAAIVVAVYLATFLIAGRPDNYYWGILYTPLLPVGFLLAPAAFRDLAAQAVPRLFQSLLYQKER
jgi:hypothetical protein